MTDRPLKPTPLASESLAHSVRDHRRAVEETVEALKDKLTRATDRVENARDRMEETTEYLREHRWPVLGAATIFGLVLGFRRKYRPEVQLMLPSGFPEMIDRESNKKKTLLRAAFATIGTMILREVGMRAIAALEDRFLKAPNPSEPPLHR